MTPEIEKLRSAAKRLKKTYATGDPQTLQRCHRYVSGDVTPKHADFLHVIARENGHESWPKLKFALETASMDRDERAERLKTALYFGQNWVIEKLLADDPDLPADNLGLQIALYDLEAVRTALLERPERALLEIGPRRPILHLAFSKYIHMAPEKKTEMLELADLLLEQGADPNDGYAAEPGSEHKLSALYGALGHADNMALAAWLLDHGADANDDESLYHAVELGHNEGLKLLIKHGVRCSGTNALPRALDFDDLEAVRLLLEHGADPNEAMTEHPSGQPVDGIPALHQAARRWRSEAVVELLLDHGADLDAIWESHTPYATARIYGNRDAASALKARGCATSLSDSERALALCADGKRPGVRIDPADLSKEDQLLLTRLAHEPSRFLHIKTLLEAGYDPDQADEMGLTALQAAGWQGIFDLVALLLEHQPDLKHVNAYGGDALSTVIHGAEHCPDRAGRDHIGCARLLLEAGTALNPQDVKATGSEAMALFLEDWTLESEGVLE
ncbi:ankyrin repeat domain-containing protein [Pelagibius sp. Alg239-R121]|uniref:ankyrin repeat domain-containing protein n=1 Tax=Pelagibius sp. Alg239-R121 TaxID=2993448 RepID=UPI0024A6CF36|nr:ankyrin repeat domain-containing protein [Pelagibius sp. Alg239-R121]